MKRPDLRPQSDQPRASGLDLAALSEMADDLRAEGDAGFAEALMEMAHLRNDIIANGPFMAYLRQLRVDAIQAVKTLPEVNPFDYKSVVAVQNAIGDYLRALESAAKTFDQFKATGRDDDDIEDADRLEAPIDEDSGEE